MTAADLVRICVVEHFWHDPRGDHIQFSLGDSALHKPLLQLGRYRCDVIGKNWDEPIQSARDCAGEPSRSNETVTGQLVRH